MSTWCPRLEALRGNEMGMMAEAEAEAEAEGATRPERAGLRFQRQWRGYGGVRGRRSMAVPV